MRTLPLQRQPQQRPLPMQWQTRGLAHARSFLDEPVRRTHGHLTPHHVQLVHEHLCGELVRVCRSVVREGGWVVGILGRPHPPAIAGIWACGPLRPRHSQGSRWAGGALQHPLRARRASRCSMMHDVVADGGAAAPMVMLTMMMARGSGAAFTNGPLLYPLPLTTHLFHNLPEVATVAEAAGDANCRTNLGHVGLQPAHDTTHTHTHTHVQSRAHSHTRTHPRTLRR